MSNSMLYSPKGTKSLLVSHRVIIRAMTCTKKKNESRKEMNKFGKNRKLSETWKENSTLDFPHSLCKHNTHNASYNNGMY